MLETPNRAIDVDRLMDEIRAEVAQTRREASPEPARHGADFGWDEIRVGLERAEQHHGVGREPPRFLRLPRAARAPARLLARGLLSVLEVITHYQRIFNREVLAALRGLSERGQGAEREIERLRREVAELRAAIGAGSDATGRGEPEGSGSGERPR